jgi:hypothetical protein
MINTEKQTHTQKIKHTKQNTTIPNGQEAKKSQSSAKSIRTVRLLFEILGVKSRPPFHVISLLSQMQVCNMFSKKIYLYNTHTL